ncbi:GNAT family N-acetyltransferase [Candidatus Woesearchaeota archaeon]|nr:GNAT family N-acetyltransferase [Candidatus Woesearchaeota archaeon]
MVTISQAKNYETPSIRKLEQQCKERDVTGKYGYGYLTKFEYVFVAKEKNKIVGVIFALKTAKEEIYVEDIIIHPKWQNQGIERRLYETLLAHCGSHPILALVKINNEASIKLHKELGFKGVKTVKNPFDRDVETESFLMRKDKKE